MGFPISSFSFGWCSITGWIKKLVDEFGRTITIEIEHFEIHRGKFYRVVGYDADVDIAAPKIWSFVVPAGLQLHSRLELETGPSGGKWEVAA